MSDMAALAEIVDEAARTATASLNRPTARH